MEKVLIVDDTKNIRMMLTTCLELEGYEVIQAKNGHEALEIFDKENINVAFIDIKMPEISGTEILRRIRGKGINIPIIIMTAFATVKNAIECTKLGAVAYLQKPFTPEKVKVVLKDIKDLQGKDEQTQNYVRLGEELLREGKVEDAISIFKKALGTDPTYGKVYFLLGKTYAYEGDLIEANKFYEAAKVFGYMDSEV